jgi:hypothetical protein
VERAGTLGDPAMDQITPMDGRPARLEAPVLVATYDTEPRSASTDALSSENDEKIRQQLRLMGSIE